MKMKYSCFLLLASFFFLHLDPSIHYHLIIQPEKRLTAESSETYLVVHKVKLNNHYHIVPRMILSHTKTNIKVDFIGVDRKD